jgi:hypothetical protein
LRQNKDKVEALREWIGNGSTSGMQIDATAGVSGNIHSDNTSIDANEKANTTHGTYNNPNREKNSENSRPPVEADHDNRTKNTTHGVVSSGADFTNFTNSFKEFIKTKGWKFGEIGPVLRAMLINKTDSVSIALIVDALGKEEVRRRVEGCLKTLENQN